MPKGVYKRTDKNLKNLRTAMKDPNVGAKISAAKMGHFVSEETKQKQSDIRKNNPNRYWLGKKRSIADKKKMAGGKGGIPLTEQHKIKIQTTLLEKGNILSANSTRLWSETSYRAKQAKANNLHPNQSEKKLADILDVLFPDEWKFVGNWEVVIARKNPDFININGQKKIIELYSSHWHEGDNPQDRIDVFKPYGYQTLVVWGNELKNTARLSNTLMKFHNQAK